MYKNLCDYFTEFDETPDRTLIIKYDDRHELLGFENGKAKIRTVRHKKLYNYQMNNDTGAGDSFAGGVIAGMVDERLNADLAGPIELGVLAAKGRMTSFDYEDPYMKIQSLTNKLFEELN